MIGRADVELDLAIVACAISAGVHGALVPDHLSEGAAVGAAFAFATALLAVLAVALTLRPSRPALLGCVAVFAGLLAAYLLATTTGLPLVHPEPEAVDGLALFTKAVELAGLLAAAHLLGRGHATAPLTVPRPRGTLA